MTSGKKTAAAAAMVPSLCLRRRRGGSASVLYRERRCVLLLLMALINFARTENDLIGLAGGTAPVFGEEKEGELNRDNSNLLRPKPQHQKLEFYQKSTRGRVVSPAEEENYAEASDKPRRTNSEELVMEGDNGDTARRQATVATYLTDQKLRGLPPIRSHPLSQTRRRAMDDFESGFDVGLDWDELLGTPTGDASPPNDKEQSGEPVEESSASLNSAQGRGEGQISGTEHDQSSGQGHGDSQGQDKGNTQGEGFMQESGEESNNEGTVSPPPPTPIPPPMTVDEPKPEDDQQLAAGIVVGGSITETIKESQVQAKIQEQEMDQSNQQSPELDGFESPGLDPFESPELDPFDDFDMGGMDDTDIDLLIVGGTRSRLNRYEYMTYLYIQEKGVGKMCGGTLISPDFVLTAAHCLPKRTLDSISFAEVGAFNRERNVGENSEIIRLAQYYDYDYKLRNGVPYHDVALFRLASCSTKTPVRLRCSSDSWQYQDRRRVKTMGWGRQSWYENKHTRLGSGLELQEVNLQLDQQCNAWGPYIDDNYMMCAQKNGAGPCFGDSGGPLLITGNYARQDCQIGIVSFGSNCADYNGGIEQYPNVFARVKNYRNWIRRIVKRDSKCRNKFYNRYQDVNLNS